MCSAHVDVLKQIGRALCQEMVKRLGFSLTADARVPCGSHVMGNRVNGASLRVLDRLSITRVFMAAHTGSIHLTRCSQLSHWGAGGVTRTGKCGRTVFECCVSPQAGVPDNCFGGRSLW